MKKLYVTVVLFFLIFAPITFQVVKSETFIIVVTSESPCFESGGNESSLGSGNPENINTFDEEPTCLTLQQFVAGFNNNTYQDSNITLELDSGEHILNSTLSVFNVTSFTMRSDAAATIICSQPSVRLQLHYIEDVIIRRTTFVGCDEIEISFVDQFRFKNSSYQSSPNGSLTLNYIMNATIIRSSFHEMTQRHCDKAAMTINHSLVLVQYCTFSNSEASIYSSLSAITIDSCTFVNNSLVGCDQIGDRTAIVTVVNGPQPQISEIVTVTNCDFVDNHIFHEWDSYTYKEVLLIYGGSMPVVNNSFVNNTGFDQLLHMNIEYGEIIMDKNNIYNNEVHTAAVDVFATNTISITISHNNFIDNTATALMLGVNNGTVTVSDSNFYGNAYKYNDQNGAISLGPSVCSKHFGWKCITNSTSIVIVNCTFLKNYSPPSRHTITTGAVDISWITGSVSIVQSTFIDNLSNLEGAALRIFMISSVLIDSCTFVENKGQNGGAIYIESASSILINHTTFLKNQGSKHYGGALYTKVDNSLIVINGSYFYDNINTKLNWTDESDYNYGYAGTVYLEGTHNSLVIDRSSFVDNAVDAIDGGIVYADGDQTGSVVILHSNFTNNTISGPPYQLDGSYGGLLISSDTVKIANSTFLNNSAANCGALSMQVLDVHIINSHFVHNSAVNYSGGAICTFQGLQQMVISNSTFSHNYAKENGGVLRMLYDDHTTVDISESTFDNNKAGLQGGVFWTVPLEAFYISNSLFIKNQAGSDGGVTTMIIRQDYYNDEINSELSISGSSFDQNKASARGGVFSSFTPYIYLVDNSSFTGNQAGTDGGVMYVGGGSSQVRITDGSTFSFNNATDRGGVILINRSRLEISNTTVFSDNFAVIGDDIIACNCVISTAFTLHSYTDPNFPNCTLYGYERYYVTTVTVEYTTDESLPSKSTEFVVAMAVSIPITFVVILLLLTATLLGAYLCFRRRGLVKQYGVRRSDHSDFVPLMNNT